jgi:hypothetical protein
MSYSELIEEIKNSDLVIFPYTEASQSGTIPLCISLKKVVMVTPTGGLPEQVKNYKKGIILENCEARTLAVGIEKTLGMSFDQGGYPEPIKNLVKQVLEV